MNWIDKRGSLKKNIWSKFYWKAVKPSMLKVIYELFDDRINQYCIENKLMRKPKVISILWDNQYNCFAIKD